MALAAGEGVGRGMLWGAGAGEVAGFKKRCIIFHARSTLRMPPKPSAPEPAPVEAAPAAPADDADKTADFAPVNMELPDIQSKFATLYTNLEKEQRARCKRPFVRRCLLALPASAPPDAATPPPLLTQAEV